MDTYNTTNYIDNLKPKKFVDYTAYLRYKKQMSLLREVYLYNTSNCSNVKKCAENLEIIKYNLRNA
jgi:hypothetical protein